MLREHDDALFQFNKFNLIAQSVIFISCANIPAFIAGRMDFVDVAWPWGLVLIGAQGLIFCQNRPKDIAICLMYIVAGARMGAGSIKLVSMGRLKFARYRYIETKWQQNFPSMTNFGKSLLIQYEVLVQCFANVIFLHLPLKLVLFDDTRESFTTSR